MKTVLAVGHLGPARVRHPFAGLGYREAEVTVAGPTTVHTARQIAPDSAIQPGLFGDVLLDLVFTDLEALTSRPERTPLR